MESAPYEVYFPPEAPADPHEEPERVAGGLAEPDRTCPRCSSTAPPLVVGGVSYCADCGVRLDPAERAAGQPAPRPVAACPTCGSTEPPAIVSSGIYCSTCGRRSDAGSVTS